MYGKITRIDHTPTAGNTMQRILYGYDPAGNRISKLVVRTGADSTYTWYVRDAQGNVLGVYSSKTLAKGSLLLNEHHLYGSSRLGIQHRELNVSDPTITGTEEDLTTGTYLSTFERGRKFFELSNHLGNVLATVSDKKLGHNAGNGQIDYYLADVVSAGDYYPFGMGMPGRKYAAPNSGYRYGFNGKENDNEVKGEGNQQDYGMRIYDPRLGRFLSVDPITATYPELTPYQFASNSPIAGVDQDGLEFEDRKSTLDEMAKMRSSAVATTTASTTNTTTATIGGVITGAAKSFSQGVAQSAIDTKNSFSSSSISEAGNNIVGTMSDFGRMMLGKKDAYKDFSHRMVNLSKSVSDPLVKPAIFMATMDKRSVNENAFGVGYYAFQVGIAAASDRLIGDLSAGETMLLPKQQSRTFNHFTNIEGITGITGLDAKMFENLAVGESVSVSKLKFGSGTNSYSINAAGDIFVTDLGVGSSTGKLNSIGVYKDRQNYVISFSEEDAFDQGARVKGSREGIFYNSCKYSTRGTYKITKTNRSIWKMFSILLKKP